MGISLIDEIMAMNGALNAPADAIHGISINHYTNGDIKINDKIYDSESVEYNIIQIDKEMKLILKCGDGNSTDTCVFTAV